MMGKEESGKKGRKKGEKRGIGRGAGGAFSPAILKSWVR
jgi:hypothetical protein